MPRPDQGPSALLPGALPPRGTAGLGPNCAMSIKGGGSSFDQEGAEDAPANIRARRSDTAWMAAFVCT